MHACRDVINNNAFEPKEKLSIIADLELRIKLLRENKSNYFLVSESGNNVSGSRMCMMASSSIKPYTDGRTTNRTVITLNLNKEMILE
ncbi:hypothetical protein Bca101_056685 [Brassica carinata]